MNIALSLYFELLQANVFKSIEPIVGTESTFDSDLKLKVPKLVQKSSKAAAELVADSSSNLYVIGVYLGSQSNISQHVLLAIPCKLKLDLELETDVVLCPDLINMPSINIDLLESEENQPDIAIGSLERYKHALQNTTVIRESGDDWETWVTASLNLFEQTCDIPLEHLATRFDEKIHRPLLSFQLCKMASNQANIHVLGLYKHLLSLPDKALTNTPLALLPSVLDGTFNTTYLPQDALTHLLKTKAATYLRGHMDVSMAEKSGNYQDRELHPLDNTQRLVNLAVSDLTDGNMLAVNGPPGSGKTAMLKAVIAHQYVEAALNGDKCPIIIAVGGTNQSVTNVINAFPDVIYHSDSNTLSLLRRWLPGPKNYGTYFPSTSRLTGSGNGRLKQEVIDNTVIGTVSTDKAAHVFSWYGKDNYLSDITELAGLEKAYLVAAEHYLTLENISLSELTVDSITVYLREKLNKVMTELALCHQSILQLVQTAQKQSTVAKTKTQSIIKELEHRFTPEKACPQALETLTALQLICVDNPTEQVKQLKQICRERVRDEFLDDDTAILLNLPGLLDDAHTILVDRLLDMTYRSTAFHIAARYWEGQYLLSCRKRILLTRTPQNVEEGLRRMCMLTPCLVSTIQNVPSIFRVVGAAGETGTSYLTGAADLLIMDETGQAEIRLALPLLGLCKKAIGVGDIDQIPPVVDDISKLDEQIIFDKNHLSDSVFVNAMSRKLTPTTGSMLHLMREAARFSYQSLGLSLRGHYRCQRKLAEYCNELVYDNKLFFIPHLDKEQGPLKPFTWVESRFKTSKVEVEGKKPSPGSAAEVKMVINWIMQKWTTFYDHYNHGADKEKRLPDIMAIVTPYTGQAELLKTAAKNAFRQTPFEGKYALTDDDLERFIIGTVNALQGAEKPIVIYSGVKGASDSGTVHIDKETHILNVAVTRAKECFVCFVCAELYGIDQTYSEADIPALLKSPVKYLGYKLQQGQRLFPRKLVIIEAGGKKQTLQELLGYDYQVMATGGVICGIGLDPNALKEDEGLLPHYSMIKEKHQLMLDILRVASSTDIDQVYLATDDDLAGESIAWHVQKYLVKHNPAIAKKCRRVLLRSITEQAVKQAISNATIIDEQRVSAEITRNILDILIWRKYQQVLSANKLTEMDKRLLDKALHEDHRYVAITDQEASVGRNDGGRVKAGILSILYEHLQQQINKRNQQPSIKIAIKINGKQLTGRIRWPSDANRKVTVAEVKQIIDRLGKGGEANVLKLVRDEPETQSLTPPSASTMALLRYAWLKHKYLPHVTMDALQNLYCGDYKKDTQDE
jgi:hypothetical protein